MIVNFTIRTRVEAIPAGCQQARRVEVYEDFKVTLRRLRDGDARLVAEVLLRESNLEEWHDILKSVDGLFWRPIPGQNAASFLEPRFNSERDLAKCRRSEVTFPGHEQERLHAGRVEEAMKMASTLAIWRGLIIEMVAEPVWMVDFFPVNVEPSLERPSPNSDSKAFRLTEFDLARRYAKGPPDNPHQPVWSCGESEDVVVIDPDAFEFRTEVEHRVYAVKSVAYHCEDLLEYLGRIASRVSEDDRVMAGQAGRLRAAIERELAAMLEDARKGPGGS
jgi:hypothetical protein